MQIGWRGIFIFLVAVLCLFIGLSHWLMPKQDGEAMRDWSEIKRSGEIRICTDYPIDNLKTENDNFQNFTEGKISKLCKMYGLEPIIIRSGNIGQQIEKLMEGECDIVAQNIPITKTMRDSIDFTESITKDKQVLVQRQRGDTVKKADFVFNQLDLKGKTVTMPEGSPSIFRLDNLSKEIGDTIYKQIIPKYDKEAIIIMVSKGEFDYTISDFKTATKMCKDYPNLDIHLSVGFSQKMAWAVKKGNSELLDSVNAFIRREQE